jgi:hypothetical protein
MSRARIISVSTVRCLSLNPHILHIGKFVVIPLGSFCAQGQTFVHQSLKELSPS